MNLLKMRFYPVFSLEHLAAPRTGILGEFSTLVMNVPTEGSLIFIRLSTLDTHKRVKLAVLDSITYNFPWYKQ